MKLFLRCMGLVLAAFLMVSVSLADKHDDAVNAAWKAKKAGDWKGAAEKHPRKLCSAVYYWNAACKVCGHRDGNGDWAINDDVTDAQKTEALALLVEAENAIEESHTQKGTVDQGCKGVDEDDLKVKIRKVRACLNGHCE